MTYAKEMFCYPLKFPTFEVVKLKSLGFRGTGYEDCVGMVYVCSPSVLQAKPMTYAREMFCYSLKFPKFEVVN